MSTPASLPSVIRDKLAAMQRREWQLATVRGLGEFFCLASAAVVLCLAADALWNLPSPVRAGLRTGLIVWLIAVAWWRLLRVARRQRSWAELAAMVEQHHPELKERLSTLVELRTDSGEASHGSRFMSDLLARQTVKAVSPLNFASLLPSRRTRRLVLSGVAAVGILLGPFLLPGIRYGLFWNRLLTPWENLDWGNRFLFVVPAGDRVVARGSDVDVQAVVIGVPAGAHGPQDVVVRWLDETGRQEQRPMTWNADEAGYNVILPRVEHSFHYRIESRSAVSRDYQITVADRPRIAAWHIEIDPPAYTGLPAKTVDVLSDEFSAPEQSRVKFHWEFPERVAAGLITWPQPHDAAQPDRPESADVPLVLAADGKSATAELLALASGPFGVQVSNDLGLASDEPLRQLAMIPDEPPSVEAAQHPLANVARPDDSLPMECSITDDYGLSAVELHWETSAQAHGSRDVARAELSGPDYAAAWQFDLADLKLASGQTVTFRWRGADNRAAPGPQETWSQPFIVTISPHVDSLEARELAAEQNTLEQDLKSLLAAVDAQKQAVDDAHRQTARAGVRGEQRPENQEQLPALEQRQQELLDQLAKFREQVEQRPLLAQTGQERIDRAQQKLSDSRAALQEANQAAGARDQIEPLSKSLDDLAAAEDELQRLEQDAKALAALERELSELGRMSRQADRLARQAESLQQESPDANNPSAPAAAATPDEKELAALQQETGALNEQLDDLLRRRPELLDAARQQALDRLKRLADAAAELKKSQAQLAEAMASDEPADAVPPPDAAANESAESLAQRLVDAIQQQRQLAQDAAQLERQAEQSPENDAEQNGATPSEDKNPPQNQALAEMTKQAAEAAKSAQLGDLKKAAQECQGACQSAQAAAKSESPSSQSASQLAERQQALANEFQKLAQSASAQKQAQQQGQKSLENAAKSLAHALEKTAQQLSTKPLDCRQSGQCSSGACQSASAAAESMSAAAAAGSNGDQSTAGQLARDAQEQLQQAAAQAAEGAGEKGQSSSQTARVPGRTAEQVASASQQLKEAQNNLSPGQSEGPSQNAGGTANNEQGKPRQGEASSPLGQSAEQLRAAARLLAAACQACQSGAPSGSGQPGQAGGNSLAKSGLPGEEGDELPEGAMNQGEGAFGKIAEGLLEAGAVPSGITGRNWGRLPKHLQTEVLQGSAKKSHPEYARQIKRYFEQIAEPAERTK